MSIEDVKNWSNLWKHNIVSTIDVSGRNYDGDIADVWKRQLSNNPGHIVDLACGNGALSWIANDVCNQNQNITRITGIDIATISPFQTLGKDPQQYPMLDFISNTSIETLPFRDSSIDTVISSHGIEYSDMSKTLPEVGRILKKNGKLACIIHTDDSDLISFSMPILTECKPLFDRYHLHTLFLKLYELTDNHTNYSDQLNSNSVVKTLQEINSAIEGIKLNAANLSQVSKSALRTYIKEMATAFIPPKPIVDKQTVFDIVASRSIDDQHDLFIINKPFIPSTLTKDKINLAKINRSRDGLAGTFERLNDLGDSVVSQAQMTEHAALLESLGFWIMERSKVNCSKRGCIGTLLVAEKK